MDEIASLLAGSGSIGDGDGRTSHEGRKAVLMAREGDITELEAIAKTMKIEIVEMAI